MIHEELDYLLSLGPQRPLTRARFRVLRQFHLFQQQNGYAPSIRELARQLNFTSHSSAQAHLSNLSRDGYMRRRREGPRGWILTRKAREILAS